VSVQIVPLSAEHVEGAVALQRLCFPPPFPEELLWKVEHLHRHHELFPDGQFVAVLGSEVLASASMARIAEERWQAHASWDETVGGPFMTHFDPEGSTLYGMDISVAPSARGQGLGRRLYEARFDALARLGCRRFGTACRVPDYASWAASTGGTVQDYVAAVARAEAIDRTLTPLLRVGLDLIAVLEEYMDDSESGNAAALLERTP